MKKYTLLAMLVGAAAWLFYPSGSAHSKIPAAEEGITFFSGSYAEALVKAKAEGKLVFVDIYASWCGPCKRLKATTFKDPAVGDFFNKNFINLAIDGEKGEGPVLAQQFGVRAYPTLVFVNADGKVVQKTVGFESAPNLLRIAKPLLQH